MSFYDHVKGIIPPSVSKTLNDFEVRLNSTTLNDEKYLIDTSNKCVIIYVLSLASKEKRALRKGIKGGFECDVPLISQSSIGLLQRLYQYNDKEDTRILKFFENILSNKDWETLRDSLFLRNEFKKRKNVSQLKYDIFTRYGERGNTISNLCTAGYFEETMIPLYNLEPKEFHKYWDAAVDRGVMALFVNSRMKIEKIVLEIKRRSKYGIKYMHIHGIGDANIEKIKECLTKESESIGFTVKNMYTDDNLHIYVAELIF